MPPAPPLTCRPSSRSAGYGVERSEAAVAVIARRAVCAFGGDWQAGEAVLGCRGEWLRRAEARFSFADPQACCALGAALLLPVVLLGKQRR